MLPAAILGLCLLLGMIGAQEPSYPTDFQSYPLRHALATEMRGPLAAMLPEGSEVAADERANRVLVRGPARAYEIAQKVVGSLDQPGSRQEAPAAPKPSGAAATSLPLKSYGCPAGRLTELAAGLQEEFGALPGVRIVPDPRTSQILVLAPPEVQARVAARMGSVGPSAAAAPAGPGAPPPGTTANVADAGQPSQPLEIQLARTTGERLESTLNDLLGRQLVPVGSTPEMRAYRVRLRNGAEIDLAVNHRTNRVVLSGAGAATASVLQLIRVLDSPAREDSDQGMTRLVPLRTTQPSDVQRTIEAIRLAGVTRERLAPGAGEAEESRVVSGIGLVQPRAAATAAADLLAQNQPGAPPEPKLSPAVEAAKGAGLLGPVRIELIEGMDILVITGRREDVEKAMKIIAEIEKLSELTKPAIEVYYLNHVDNAALGTLVNTLNAQALSLRTGTVSITPLIRPNAMLLIGRIEAVQEVIKMIQKLDVGMSPAAGPQQFRLKHASATAVQTVLLGLYPARTGVSGAPGAPGAPGFPGGTGQGLQGGLAAQVHITVDPRTNSIIVQAPPREMAEIATLIARIDVQDSEMVLEIKVYPLKHALASEMALLLQDAIAAQGGAQAGAAAQGRAPGGPAAGGAPVATPGARAAAGTTEPSAMLQFVVPDSQGQRRITSGILTDVSVTANQSANSVIVTAPAGAQGLIDAVIKQLDQPPTIRSEVKVFEIKHASAPQMYNLLLSLFGQQQTMGAMGGQTGQTTFIGAVRGEGETSLAQLRFAGDFRTNTIIASGTAADLAVVHAVIMRMDTPEVRYRKTVVYRLKNVPATETAGSLMNFLQNERTLDRSYFGGYASPFDQVEQEVVVVPEPITNSLIVSATPKFFTEVEDLIKKLDERPPMVVIQVLIAELELHDTDEFGVELGLQDSVLFNRSVPGTDAATGAATLIPGFPFVGLPLGNSPDALASARRVGTQGVTSFSLNRANNNLGYGGLVFSASSESVSIMLRALKESRRLEVLSRPQITTLNNQIAKVMVGQKVPMISGVSQTTFGQTNSVEPTDVGVILQVTPRVCPDGMVVMEIDAIRSAVGPEEEGIPVFVSTGGTVVRQPRINMSMALTTVSAADGQTIVLGGMIQKDTVTAHRRVPYLSDVPVLGNIFRYDLSATVRRELLIIMTPHVVYNEEDADRIKKVEAARMQWCLADVVDMYGDFGIRRRRDEWSDADVPTIYPDLKPTVERVPTPVPAEKRQEAAPPVPQPVAPTAPSIGTPPAVPPAGTPPPAPGLAPKAKLLQPGGGALRAPWPPTDRNRPQAEPQAANEGGPPALVEPASWVDPQGPPAAVPSYSPPASANPLRGY